MVARREVCERHEAVRAIGGRTAAPAAPMLRAERALRIWLVAVLLLLVAFLLNVLQLLALPVNALSRSLYYRVSSFAAGLAWGLCQYFVEGQDNVRMSFSGIDRIPQDESAFVISNHAYFGDFFLVHTFAQRRRMLGACRYFAKVCAPPRRLLISPAVGLGKVHSVLWLGDVPLRDALPEAELGARQQADLRGA